MFKFILGFFAGLIFAVATLFLGAVGYSVAAPPPKPKNPYMPPPPPK